MLVSTEAGSDTAATRERMMEILTKAWLSLPDVVTSLGDITKNRIEAALRTTGPSGRIDLVHDLASSAAYDVVVKLYGTPGPLWLTELAVALPFAHQHVGELQPDWLRAAQAGARTDVGLASLQIWSILMFVDIVGNYEQQPELMALSSQAGAEMLSHLNSVIVQARARKAPPANPPTPPPNLLAAFVSLEDYFVKHFGPGYSSTAYYTDVRMLLLELVSTTVANIPAAFGAVMDAVLKFNIPLTELVPVLLDRPAFVPPGTPPPPPSQDGVVRLIYETCRLNGLVEILMRTCMQQDTLPSGAVVQKDDLVAALVGVAAFDPNGFPEPMRLSLHPFLPGPNRDIANYLMFGATVGTADETRDCWGRERVALSILKECVKAAGRLQHLQRVAGEAGNARKLAHLTIGLSARFSAVLPDWQS